MRLSLSLSLSLSLAGMRMAGPGGESSVMVVMPTKPNLPRPAPLSLPLPTSTDTHSADEHTVAKSPEDMGSKRRRRSGDDGSSTDEEGDATKSTYECRFCKMKFAKSQALGGHMNRHRQEREDEQLQHAQQLLSSLRQPQMPRSWTTMAAELNNPSAAQLARLSSQLPSPRQQLPPQISFNSPQPLPSPNYYLPSDSCSNNLQHLQWNVDGFHATHLPRPQTTLDSMPGAIHNDFLFSNPMTAPLPNPGNLPFGHDHVLRQLPSAPLNPTLMPETKAPVRTSVPSPPVVMQTGKQAQMMGPRPLGYQYHGTSSMFSGHAFATQLPSFGSALPGNHDFSNVGPLEFEQYRSQTSSGSASESFGHESMFGHVKMAPDEYHHLCPEMESAGANTTSVVHEVVDGNHCESMNITTVTESGDVSRMSAPARYQSTDFSSGSPPSQEYCSE